MKNISQLLLSLASILWPLTVLTIALLYRKTVISLVDSFTSRKLEIGIGKFKLSIADAIEHQQTLIQDLQTQVLTQGEIEYAGIKAEKILWVDDVPDLISSEISYLSDNDVMVVEAFSTADALAKLRKARFDVIITDIGRYESGIMNTQAGIDLAKAVRSFDKEVPIVAFCVANRHLIHANADVMKGAGINKSISSPIELYRYLGLGS